jgi:hypothetical protein
VWLPLLALVAIALAILVKLGVGSQSVFLLVALAGCLVVVLAAAAAVRSRSGPVLGLQRVLKTSQPRAEVLVVRGPLNDEPTGQLTETHALRCLTADDEGIEIVGVDGLSEFFGWALIANVHRSDADPSGIDVVLRKNRVLQFSLLRARLGLLTPARSTDVDVVVDLLLRSSKSAM